MRSIILPVLIAFLCINATTGMAWDRDAHEKIGGIADQLLNQNAATHVHQILGYDVMTLGLAATWADCVKGVEESDGGFRYKKNNKFPTCNIFESKDGKARMEDYVARNWRASCGAEESDEPCHKQYHYADVAFQNGRYDRSYVGTSDHDVVSAIDASIAVLRNMPTPKPFDIKDKKEALLLLSHFVGDIHQPLHVGTAYLNQCDKLFVPDKANPPVPDKGHTRGGNLIKLGPSNLHFEWDKDPAIPQDTLVTSALSQTLTSGDISTWAAHWGSETISVSKSVFSGIALSREGNEDKQRWAAYLADKEAYAAAMKELKSMQMAKAGARLAHILNNVWGN